MDLGYRTTTLESGVCFDTFLSGIQKGVRLCYPDELIWACEQVVEFLKVELGVRSVKNPPEPSEQIKRAKGCVTNILHRLMVIYLEDVHAGEPHLWSYVETSIKKLMGLRTITKGAVVETNLSTFYNTFKELVVVMAFAQHSRLYSHIRKANHADTPQEWRAACVLDESLKPILKYLTIVDTEAPVVQGVDVKWWKKELPGKKKVSELGNKGKDGETWLAYAAASIHEELVKGSRNRNSDLINMTKNYKSKPLGTSTPPFFSSPFVIDCHTKEGKKLANNEGKLRFFLLGSNVVNERFILPPSFHMLYTIYNLNQFFPDIKWPCTIDQILDRVPFAKKVMTEMGVKESNLFHYEIRAQLTCAVTRADTYFARLWGFPVFVKGPFLPADAVNARKQLRLYDIKKGTGMAALKTFEVKLTPDQFGGAVPLGARNKCNIIEKYSFIVSASLITSWPIKSKVRTSKVWPETTVVDWDHIQEISPPDIKNMNERELDNFIIACTWRHVMGILDNALRNFIWKHSSGEVYSVDEDNPMHSKTFNPFRFTNADRMIVQNRLSVPSNTLTKFLSQFKEVLESIKDTEQGVEACLERLCIVSSPMGLVKMFDYSNKRSNDDDTQKTKIKKLC